jgi:hypothetical protein
MNRSVLNDQFECQDIRMWLDFQQHMRQVNVSAYMVVEGTVRDKEALGRYGS